MMLEKIIRYRSSKDFIHNVSVSGKNWIRISKKHIYFPANILQTEHTSIFDLCQKLEKL